MAAGSFIIPRKLNQTSDTFYITFQHAKDIFTARLIQECTRGAHRFVSRTPIREPLSCPPVLARPDVRSVSNVDEPYLLKNIKR
jgi:hypothetical protein